MSPGTEPRTSRVKSRSPCSFCKRIKIHTKQLQPTHMLSGSGPEVCLTHRNDSFDVGSSRSTPPRLQLHEPEVPRLKRLSLAVPADYHKRSATGPVRRVPGSIGPHLRESPAPRYYSAMLKYTVKLKGDKNLVQTNRLIGRSRAIACYRDC